MDVEHGTELVPVFGLKSPCTEFNAVHHVRVGEGQALLLAGAHQERAIDFDVVDIDQILVKGPPRTLYALLSSEVKLTGAESKASSMVPRGVGILLARRGSMRCTVTSLGPSPTTSASPRLVPGLSLKRWVVGALKGDALGFAAVSDKRRLYCPGAFAWEDDAELSVAVCGDAQADVFFHQNGGAGQDRGHVCR